MRGEEENRGGRERKRRKEEAELEKRGGRERRKREEEERGKGDTRK